MARPLRLEHSGAIWHVTARGNRKEDVFLDDWDRRAFLEHLAVTVEMYKWRIHAWVLMTNHCPWERLTGQIYLGREAFRERVDALLSPRPPAIEIPRSQREPTPRPSLDQVPGAVVVAFETTDKEVRLRRRGPARKAFALLARRSAAAPLCEVADLLGINPWSASHSASAGAMLEAEDPQFRRRLQSARGLVEELATRQT